MIKATDSISAAVSASRRIQVGVIIPVFNRASIVLETLNSIARQSRQPTKVVIVDDGSIDGSLAAVEQWIGSRQLSFEPVLIRQRHMRAAAARNRGLQELVGIPLVAFLDSDDRWPSDFLARTVGALERWPEAVAATVDRKFIDGRGTIFRCDDCRDLALDPIVWIFRHGGGIASSTLFRTNAVLAAGTWNATMPSSEDSMLFSHIALQGEWIHVAGEPVEFQHGIAANLHEEVNESLRHADCFRRFAREYETIYRSLAGRVCELQLRQLRSGLAVYWYRAGKQLVRLGDRTAALECYRRAIEWKPVFLRAWRRRWELSIRAALATPVS